MSGPPTTLVEDGPKSNHTSKIGNSRVSKACVRCNKKKTKCDGASSCKKCRGDGVVCVYRGPTASKEYPKVLEDIQIGLIDAIQKLYTMVRNNESWDLGEPELNDKGQPDINDIVFKLCCISLSRDLPVAVSQLQASRTEMGAEDTVSGSSPSSPSLAHMERVGGTKGDHKGYKQTGAKVEPPLPNASSVRLQQRTSEDDTSYASIFSTRESFDTNTSVPSPIYTDFQTQSPMFRKASPFPSWSANEDFLGQPNALDLTAQFMRAQQYSNKSGLDGSLVQPMDLEPNVLNFTDGTITPHMLDCNGYDPSSQMDNLIFGNEYESQMGRA